MAKLISLCCPTEAILILVKCLNSYAEAAYPKGASECSQASRAALLDAALKIKLQCDNKQFPVNFSRRLSTSLKAALIYCDENHKNPLHDLLIKAISGDEVKKSEWDLNKNY